jgi:hypothetical protein
MNRLMIAAAAVCLISGTAFAGEVTLSLGRFKPGSSFPDEATQFVTVNNGTDSSVDVLIECGFLRGPQLVGTDHEWSINGPQLVGTDHEWSINIPAGQSAHEQLETNIDGPVPDRAECRISQIERSNA